jgi:hypothetical protein
MIVALLTDLIHRHLITTVLSHIYWYYIYEVKGALLV